MKNLKIVLLFSLFLAGAFLLYSDNEYAISLDGEESFYINDGNDALDVSDNWTFEAWIKVGSYVSGNYECIMDRRTVFSFYLIPDVIEPFGDYAVKFAARDGTTIVASLQSDSLATMSFDSWYHVAATFDGTDARLFVNDTEVDTDDDADWSLTSAGYSINVGGRYWGSYTRQMSNADIDEIRVSDIARTTGSMQTSVDDDPYVIDSNTILLMHLNDLGNPPTYESGTDPLLTGTNGDDEITSADYVDPGNLSFGDQSAPIYSATYPKIMNETSTSVELAAQIDEDGIAYYVVLENEAAAPSVSEVKAGTGNGGSPAIENGNIALVADTENTDLIDSLTENTNYDIYVVAEDDEVPPNVQDAVTLLEANTLEGDATPPIFAENYPNINEITTTTLELAIQIDEDGTAYFVVLENNAVEPSVLEVKAGTGNGGSPAIENGNISLFADTENTETIDSLTVSTDYDIYVVAEDDEVIPNTQVAVTKIDASTLLNYRSKNSGDWFSRGNWERYNGTSWIDADESPDFADNTILIRFSHTITLSDTVKIDQMTIESNGQITVAENGYFTINNGSDVDLVVSGILRKEGNGIITRLNSPSIDFLSESKFELAGTNKFIIEAVWDENSTCEISGDIGGDMTATYHTDQAFGNFIWNCPGQTENVYCSGALTDINGNFQIIDTNGFEFRLTGTAGDDPSVYIAGNVEISGGILNLTSGDNNIFFVCDSSFTQSGGEIKSTGTGTGNLRFGPMTGSGYSGIFTHSAGTFTPDNIQIREGYALTLNSNINIGTAPFIIYGTLICGNYDITGSGLVTLGNSSQLNLTDDLNLDEAGFVVEGIVECGIYTISGDSTFTINSTGVIRTGNSLGLNGTILMSGDKTFSPAADYEFNGTVAQITGSFLPTGITDGLKINNPSGVTLSQNTTISGGNSGLELVSGNLIVPTDSLFSFAADGGWNYGGENSFIDGTVAKIRNSTTGFLFPIGKDTLFGPLQIFPESTDETTFITEYFSESYTDVTTCEDSLGNISTIEYWTLDRISGLANAKVRLYWDDHSFGTFPDSLVVARWSDSLWVNAGQFEIDLVNKWITSETVSEFSPFTFGEFISGTPEQPGIPANVNIEVIAGGDSIRITWTNEGFDYKIYSNNDPYGSFENLETTVINVGEVVLEIIDSRKFYQVTANN